MFEGWRVGRKHPLSAAASAGAARELAEVHARCAWRSRGREVTSEAATAHDSAAMRRCLSAKGRRTRYSQSGFNPNNSRPTNQPGEPDVATHSAETSLPPPGLTTLTPNTCRCRNHIFRCLQISHRIIAGFMGNLQISDSKDLLPHVPLYQR